MSYDVWAWKWATNEVPAKPRDIAAISPERVGSASSSEPGLTELVIDQPLHPALAPFAPDELFASLRHSLGRHFDLKAERPALHNMELYRDAEGRGWRLDFAVDRDLVSHLLPVGLGRAFAALGMVVYDAWRERIVRPGLPKTLVFEFGGAEPGAIYEPDWSEVEARLDELGVSDFAILENQRGDYVQCAGSADAVTVECRVWAGAGFHHWVAGAQRADTEPGHISGPDGPIAVRGYEVLQAPDVVKIFRAFFDSGVRHTRYRWRDITSAFR